MSQFDFDGSRAFGATAELETSARTDMAVRFMNQVFGWMAGGLAVSGATAWYLSQNEALMLSALKLFVPLIIVELVVVVALSAAIKRMSATVATGAFLFYALLNGITLSPVLLAYTGASVANVFFVTAGTFTAMAIIGATTRRDLTSMGGFLLMGLIAIILASVVNFWLQSTALQFACSAIGALIFTGLTAYDVQVFRKAGYMGFSNPEQRRKTAIIGALNLYLDFINLFLNLLRLFGSRR